MEYKMVTPANLPQVMALWDYCFEKAGTPFFEWYFREYCLKNNLVLGGFAEKTGQLANMLHLNPYNVLLRGRKEAMPYIVGVATAPGARGRHLTCRCWRWRLRCSGASGLLSPCSCRLMPASTCLMILPIVIINTSTVCL
jgi:predicted acetyltransferase